MKKKITISRILAVLFAAVMTACFVPQTGALVYADDAGAKVPISGLYVGDSSEVTKAGEISNTGGTGRATVSTDETTGSVILTLNSFHYNGTGFKESAIDYNGEAPLIIELVGENEITTSSETGINWHGNNSSGKKLTIKGGGASLLVDADTNGILNKLGKVVIEGCTVKANVTRTGIYAMGVTVSNAKIVATAKTKEADKVYGIYSSGSITIDGSQVEAYGSSGASESGKVWGYGLCAGDYAVIKNGSAVTAVGNLKAIYGTVKNDVGGKGWADANGSGYGTTIETSEEGKKLEDYKKIFIAPVHKHDGITFEPWGSIDSLPKDSGSYCLTSDVIRNGVSNVASEINLCLNGHSIIQGSQKWIQINPNGTLNLYDCQATGSISGCNCEGYGCVTTCGGIFNMYGGTISGNSCQYGGVFVNGGTFNMSGGTISGNSAEYGGGVSVATGTFNMSGGTITENSASGAGGGVIVGVNAEIQLSGSPRITGNTVNDKPNNIYLGGDRKAIITGELNPPADASAPQIGVTMEIPGVFTNDLSDKLPAGKTASDVFFSDDADCVIRETTEHEAELVRLKTVTVTKAPTASAINSGQSLAASTLTGGIAMDGEKEVPGTFAWTDPAIRPNVADSNKTEYSVTFTPADANYKTETIKVKLTVIDKKQAKISLDAGLKGTSSKGKVTAKWGKVKDADSYDVYAAYCEGNSKYKKIKTVSGKTNKLVIKKLAGKKLNPKRNVKYYVVAYKTIDGKKVKLARSLNAHVVGSANKGWTNIKSIKVTKKAVTLKKGKTAKIKAKLVLYKKGKKTLDHERKFRYATSNDKVATVSKNGKIKAVGKGKCDIYVYAQNGCAKKIKVTVK